jgi:hypothetical protein
MTRPLLAERRFAPLFRCRFPFNDNLLKNALVFLPSACRAPATHTAEGR